MTRRKARKRRRRRRRMRRWIKKRRRMRRRRRRRTGCRVAAGESLILRSLAPQEPSAFHPQPTGERLWVVS